MMNVEPNDTPPAPSPASRAAGRLRRRLGLGTIAGLALLMIVPTSWPDEALARRGGGFSRSLGRRSFGGRSRGFRFRRSPTRTRRSSGWGSARAGGYKRKGGLFGNRRSSRGTAFQRGKRPLTGTRAPRRNSRGHRMLGQRTGRSNRAQRATAFQQRHRRPTTVINRHYYGGRRWGTWGWGMGRVGIWDVFFLSTVSHMFWYHHWHDPGIQRALRQENLMQKEELAKLEKRVGELESQGVKRDPNYLPEGVDPDLAYAKDYVEKNQTEFYAEEAPPGQSAVAEAAEEPLGTLWVLFGLAGLALLFYGLFIRRW